VGDDGVELVGLRDLTIKQPGGEGSAAGPDRDLRLLLDRLRTGEIGETEAEAAMEAYLAV
jgi:hypothetical protein